jgi:hypothetical protein
VRALEGPWLLYDNEKDPYQMQNLIGDTAHGALEAQLDAELEKWLERTDDDFQPREVYWRRFGYEVDDRKQMPYINKVGQHDL